MMALKGNASLFEQDQDMKVGSGKGCEGCAKFFPLYQKSVVTVPMRRPDERKEKALNKTAFETGTSRKDCAKIDEHA